MLARQETSILLVSLIALVASACGGKSTDSKDPLLSVQECNPLGGNGCITPWPSNLYAVADSSTVTGMRLDIPLGALPTNLDNVAIDPAPLNSLDGFSCAAPIIVSFAGGVDDSSLVPSSRYVDSLGDGSPTVIINMATGERVAHFAELDIRDPDRIDKQALYIRPAQRLTPGTRYAVAIRKSLKALDGSPLPISPGFAALQSGEKTPHLRLEARRDAFSEVLTALETAGIAKEDLVVAWDFSTASDESIRRDLVSTRERTLAAAGTDGANLDYTISEDQQSGPFRRIDGTFTAPLFLTNDGAFSSSTTGARDADDLPELQGMHEVAFTAIVPDCAKEAAEPVPMILYGHGLLGNQGQTASGSQRALSEEMCAVMVGTILRGMSDKDVPNVLLALNDYNRADQIFNTLLQGISNHWSLVQAMRGPMSERLFVDSSGTSLVDKDKIYYYGLSQGGIFGATIAAYDEHITRAALGVGAANYSMMLERSADWPTYRTVVIGAYDDPLNVSIILNLLQTRWDTTESTNIIGGWPAPPVAGIGETQFLMQIGVADREVPNVASEYQARSLGLPILSPAVYQPYGIDEKPGPLPSALVIYDGGDGPIPDGDVPPEENRAHVLARNSAAAREQIQTFFRTGQVVHTCGQAQPCDCTTGACDRP